MDAELSSASSVPETALTGCGAARRAACARIAYSASESSTSCSSSAARSGDAGGNCRASVHIPDSTLPMNPRVNALEPVDITPMSRSRLAVDRSALGQHFGAGTPREQERVPACLLSDPRDDRRIYGGPDIDDLRDDHDVGITMKPRCQVFEREMRN